MVVPASGNCARVAQGAADDNYDDDDDGQPFAGVNEPGFAPQPPMPQAQPFLPRDAQPFPPRDQQQHRPQQNTPQPQHQPYVQPRQDGNNAAPDVGGLPAFITGGGGQPQPNVPVEGQNGHDQGGGQDRFGHRRRRRHRGGGSFNNRPDNFGNVAPQGAAPSAPGEGGDEPPRQPE